MRKSLPRVFVVSLLAMSILGVLTAGAQERRGTITGRVTDSTSAVVQGARIELQPGGQSAVSDGQGEFTIVGLTPGQYTLTVSALGFAQFAKKDLAVTAGGVANVEAALQIDSRTEVVEVQAGRQHGEVEALNRERTAENILEVIPSEVITSLPNSNVADAVGRMNGVSLERDEGEGKYVQIRGTEPRLSNVTVDGVHLPSPENVRNVKLDAIPSDLVDSVELNKTLQANQEGDAIGGSVNLVTKSASNQPYVSMLGLGGFTPQAGGRTLNQQSITLGQRFFQKKLGILVGGSRDFNGRGIDDVEPAQGVNGLFPNGPNAPQVGTFTGPNTYDQREYLYNRTRFGFAGTLDYKLGEFSSAYIRGLFSQFKDDGQDFIYSPTVGTFATPTLTNADGSSSYTHVTRKPAQRLFSTTAGAHQTFGKTLLNYELSFGQARFTGFFPSTKFSPVLGGKLSDLQGNGLVQFAVNTTNPFTPVLTAQNANIFDPTQYAVSQLDRGDDHTFERDVTGSASIARNYNAGSHFGTLELGIRVRDAHKSELDTLQVFTAPDQSILLSSVLRTFTNPNYYFGVYPSFGPTSDYGKIIAAFNANSQFMMSDLQAADLQQTVPADFNVDERVTAGYIQNSIGLGRFRLIGGVRIEATSESFLANHSGVDNLGNPLPFTQVPGSQDYIDALPSVQLQTRFGSDTILRLGYGLGIARPNFSELPPHITEDRSNPARQTVDLGNPALKRTHAQNVDILIEHYFKPLGVIEGGFFYKFLTDPIYSVQSNPTAGTFAGFFQNQPVNGPSARIFGFEMALQQRLSFLPGVLNGSGVRANYSYTSSQATFPTGAFANAGQTRSDQPALQRQSPNTYNFDYTYDKKGVSASLGLTHNDASISQYSFQQGAAGGLKGPNGDQYFYPHTQVDTQASYWLPRSHGFQLIGSVLNLTNETFGFYQGSERFPIQREYYNRTYALGLRWSPSREHR